MRKNHLESLIILTSYLNENRHCTCLTIIDPNCLLQQIGWDNLQGDKSAPALPPISVKVLLRLCKNVERDLKRQLRSFHTERITYDRMQYTVMQSIRPFFFVTPFWMLDKKQRHCPDSLVSGCSSGTMLFFDWLHSNVKLGALKKQIGRRTKRFWPCILSSTKPHF